MKDKVDLKLWRKKRFKYKHIFDNLRTLLVRMGVKKTVHFDRSEWVMDSHIRLVQLEIINLILENARLIILLE